MRKYYPIWHKIKHNPDHICRITAPVKFHPRIIKKVINEKYIDLGFKILLDEEKKTAKLSFERNGSEIVFKLNFSIGIGDL